MITAGSHGLWFCQLVGCCRLCSRRNDQRVHLVSPELFLAWWAGIGKTGQPGNPNPMIYVFTLLAAFVQAVAVSFMINLTGGETATSGALSGFMFWLGFVATTNLVNKLFAGYGFKVWAIESDNPLLNFLLFGAILGAWH